MFQKLSDDEVNRYIEEFQEEPEYQEIKTSIRIEEGIRKVEAAQESITKKLPDLKMSLAAKDYRKLNSQCFSLQGSLRKSIQAIGEVNNILNTVIKEPETKRFDVNAEISLEGIIVHIVLNELLPHRPTYDVVTRKMRYSYDREYLRNCYTASFNKFCKNGKPIWYTGKVVLYFINHSNGNKDHDNLDQKPLVDVITTYLLPDDNPKWCSHYMDFKEDNKEYTELYVIPEKHFIAFLSNKKATP